MPPANEPRNGHPTEPSSAVLERLVGDFEDAWLRGERPVIDAYLNAAAVNRRALLIELVHADLERRLKSGDEARVETYLRQYPELATDADVALGLIQAEHDLRRRRDPYLTAAEYLERFPEYRLQLMQNLGGEASSVPDTLQPPSPDSTTPEGRTIPCIGKYRVIERLGGGGQGDVYRAVHPTLSGRDVVIKLAKPTTPELQQQVVEEARLLARLDDPGLVRVYDADVYEGRPYIVFEHVAGRTLRECVKQGLPPPRQAARWVAELARTLDRVHRKGVLHRDLKPGNVLLDEQGRPRLLDFGLAQTGRERTEPSKPAEGLAGTLNYMAPEQARNDVPHIGPQTDVFGLRAILYELLTGRPPYEGETQVEVWYRARERKLLPPRQHRPGLPRSLERICLRALAPEPEARYASAAEMQRALRGYLLRPRLTAWALATAGILGVVMGVLYLLGGRPPDAGPDLVKPLQGQLVLRVWSEGDEAKRGLRVGDAGALPVRRDDLVRLEVRVNQPAYVYVLWVDSLGKVEQHYPPGSGADAVQEVFIPSADSGARLSGPRGLETALALVCRQPLPAGVDLLGLCQGLRPSAWRQPDEWQEFTLGEELEPVAPGRTRALDSPRPVPLDDPVVTLCRRLQPHFAWVQAIRFAYEGD